MSFKRLTDEQIALHDDITDEELRKDLADTKLDIKRLRKLVQAYEDVARYSYDMHERRIIQMKADEYRRHYMGQLRVKDVIEQLLAVRAAKQIDADAVIDKLKQIAKK